LALLAPLYRLFPIALTLLVVQCAAVALSVVPVTVAARRLFGGRAALLVGSAYGLSWGLASGIDSQFHEYALAVPVLAFALAALLAGRWLAAALWAGTLPLVKEDLALTVVVVGRLMVAIGRWRLAGFPELDRQRCARIGTVLALVGAVAGLLIFTVLIPLANPDGQWDYWEKLNGESAGWWSGLKGLPVPAEKVDTLVLLVAVSAGAALVSPLALLAVPTLVWRFASADPHHWGAGYQYSMILMPIVFLALVDAAARLGASASAGVRAYARVAPLAAAFALGSRVHFPLGKVADPVAFGPSERAAAAEAALVQVPGGASVAGDCGLIAYLTGRCDVYWLGGDSGAAAPDYVLIDPQSGWSDDPGDPAQVAEFNYPGHRSATVDLGASAGDYRLAERRGR
jgi:uncharacterized membrane protein